MSITRPNTRTYEDFEPTSEWTAEEEFFTTLLVYLPGFKRDQLKLQVDREGNLKMTGERQLDGQRSLRFTKHFRIPENCTSTAGIRAKLENEILQVRFPIVVAQPPAPAPQQPPSQEATTATTAPPPPQMAAATTTASEREMTQKANGKSMETAGRALTQEKSQTNGKSTVAREKSEKKKEEIMNLTQPKEEVAGKEKIDQEGISKKPEQQMISEKKTGDDKSSDEQKTVQQSSPGSNDGGIDRVREEMTRYSVGGILKAGLITPSRKVLLVNLAVACLLMFVLGLYFKYK